MKAKNILHSSAVRTHNEKNACSILNKYFIFWSLCFGITPFSAVADPQNSIALPSPPQSEEVHFSSQAAPPHAEASLAPKKERTSSDSPPQLPQSPASLGSTLQPIQNPSLFRDHIQRSGITSCSRLVDILGTRTAETEHGVLSNWHSTKPDEHIFHSFIGLNYKNKGGLKTGASILVASPQKTSSCEGMVINVLPSSLSCSDIAKKIETSKGGKKIASLATVPVFNEQQGGNILLVPSGRSCVIISTLQAFDP